MTASNHSHADMHHAHACSRKASRAARRILQQGILAHKEVTRLLQPGCPFNPSLDYFSKQESSMLGRVDGLWECGLCKKTFVSQFYLDRHFDNRHQSELRLQDDSLCLGDACAYIPCGLHDTPCSPEGAQSAKAKCIQDMDKCFRLDEAHSIQLHDALVYEVCEPITCDENQPTKMVFASILNTSQNWDQATINLYVAVMVGLAVLGIVVGKWYINKFTITRQDFKHQSRGRAGSGFFSRKEKPT